MSSVDWRGVAMALGQLKDIAGPTELQKMQFQSDLIEGRAEDAREFESREKQKDRMYNAATDKFKILQERHEKLQTRIAKKESNILGITAAYDFLSDEEKSSGPAFDYLKADNELTPLQQAQQNTLNIENTIKNDIKELTRITNAETGVQFGKELRISEGAVAFKQVQELYDAGKITEQQYKRAMNYDTSGDVVVSPQELKMGLMNQLLLMEEAGLPTTGVEAGYWAEYKGNMAQTKKGFDFQTQMATAAEDAYKAGNVAWKAEEGIPMDDGTAQNLIEEFMNMAEFLSGGGAAGLAKKFPKKDQEKYLSRMSEIITDIAGAQKGEFLESLFLDGITAFNPDSQTVEINNTQYFSEAMKFGYEAQGFGKDVYARMIHYNIYAPNKEYGTAAQRTENLKLRREYTFMVKKWENGIAGGLPDHEQRRFNEIHEDMVDMKDKGYFDEYSQDNLFGYRIND